METIQIDQGITNLVMEPAWNKNLKISISKEFIILRIFILWKEIVQNKFIVDNFTKGLVKLLKVIVRLIIYHIKEEEIKVQIKLSNQFIQEMKREKFREEVTLNLMTLWMSIIYTFKVDKI